MNKEEFGKACDYFIDQTAFNATNEQRAFLRQCQEAVDSILREEEKQQKKLRKETISQLKNLIDGDIEINHCRADEILVDYIRDKSIKRVYESIPKYYS